MTGICIVLTIARDEEKQVLGKKVPMTITSMKN